MDKTQKALVVKTQQFLAAVIANGIYETVPTAFGDTEKLVGVKQELSLRERDFCTRALAAVYAGQTSDEKAQQQTKYLNGQGFAGSMSDFKKSVCEQAANYVAGASTQPLTTKQSIYAAKWTKRHAGQVVQRAERKPQQQQQQQQQQQEGAKEAPSEASKAPVAARTGQHTGMTTAQVLGGNRQGTKFTQDAFGRRNTLLRAGSKKGEHTFSIDGINTVSERAFIDGPYADFGCNMALVPTLGRTA